MDTERKVNIIRGDIFNHRKGILVIPRSTAGTINESFERGLNRLKVKYIPKETELGDIELDRSLPDVELIYATSVQNGSSTYAAVQQIARKLQEFLQNRELENVYCPLLGTGAGQLDTFLAYVYIVLPFYKAEPRYAFNLVVFDGEKYDVIIKSERSDRFDLLRKCLKTLYKDLRKDVSIQAVLRDVNFFYERALVSVSQMLAYKLSKEAKQKLIEEHTSFDGNFQEFIDHQDEPKLTEFLVLVGTVVAHLDSKGYNKHIWNTNKDQRTLAHANVRQNLWVRHLMIYSMNRDLSELPNNIRNALYYLDNPETEVPVLSIADRELIRFTFIEENISDNQFGRTMIDYMQKIISVEPENSRNMGALTSRIFYSPLVRLLWDYTVPGGRIDKLLNVGHVDKRPSWKSLDVKSIAHEAGKMEKAPDIINIKGDNKIQDNKTTTNDNKPPDDQKPPVSNNEPPDDQKPPDNNKSPDNDDGNNKKVNVKLGQKLHSDVHADQDLLNYESYAQTLFNFIKSKDTQSPLTIGIYAPWGMGKTSLMHSLQTKLDKNVEVVNKTYWELQQRIHQYIQDHLTRWQKFGIAIYNAFVRIGNRVVPFLGLLTATPIIIPGPDSVAEPKAWMKLTVADLQKEIKKQRYAKRLPRQYSNPTVWFNPWKYEDKEQILSGLAYTILDELVRKLPNDFERERFYFNLNRKRFDHEKLKENIRSRIHAAIFNTVSITLMSGAVVFFLLAFWLTDYLFGISAIVGGFSVWQAMAMVAKVRNTDAAAYFNQFVTRPKYEEKLGYFHEVETDLKNALSLLVDNENRCVIFIDDLDRCSSKTVVEVIEAINLFVNGDFPHCYFIIGMDAQMVAASIEAQYNDINERLPVLRKQQGSLGWYFMEKFVQLQFNIPSMSERSGRLFLNRLLEIQADEPKEKIDLTALQLQAQSVQLTEPDSIRAFAESLNKAEVKHPVEVAQMRALIVTRAGESLNEINQQAMEMLSNYSQYVCISPRLIKRFVNAYRFYWSMKLATMGNGLNDLKEFEIAKMAIISIRWPQLLRLVQWTNEYDFGDTCLKRAQKIDLDFIQKAHTSHKDEGLKWLIDPMLSEFMKDIKLERFVHAGAW